MKPILTITGSDPTGVSGVQADIKTISDLGGLAMSAITSITVQTTFGIQEFYDIPASIIEGQIDAVMNDFQPDVVKIGLIRNVETLKVIVNALKKYRPRHVVFDAVRFSSLGDTLISQEMRGAIIDLLLPLCSTVIKKDEDATHGLSNIYSSAIAFFLNQGLTQDEAKEKALSHINAKQPKTIELKGRGSELHKEFLNLVTKYHREASDVHFYAELLNVSARYLAQVTRRISGKSPKSIIDDYLIHEIESLLKTSNLTAQEIAYHFGFSSQAHFSKFFKKIKGISPTQFRKQ
ncbi:MAG: bifunctional hydroxymethylpyrimidine kinase/phosphomethylpyrimidine kinase [Paludibacteraceae bacterium]|nr:bifunctional hydroxymethylpyrimidine kinase/phosphomethylpyrimidine kinase [Paludibacteraceae bacterium]